MKRTAGVRHRDGGGPGSGLRDGRLWAWLMAEGLSQFGDQFFAVALAVAAVRSGGAAGAGAVLAIGALPKACLLLLGGSLVDRLGPRRLMLGSDVTRMCLMAALALFASVKTPGVWTFAAVSFFFGVLDSVFEPAANTLPARLVAGHELARVQGLRTTLSRAALIAGGPAGGLAVAAGGPGLSFAADAVTFGVSAVALCGLRVVTGLDPSRAVDSGGAGTRLLAETVSGVKYVAGHPLLRTSLLLLAVIEFCLTGPVNVGVPVLSQQRGWGALGIGLLNGAFAAGAIAGPLSLVLFGRRVRAAGRLALVSAALGSACYGLIGFASLPVAAALAAGLGLTAGFLGAVMVPVIQTTAEPAFLGRVMSLLALAFSGLTPVSLAAGGLAFRYLGTAPTIAGCAAVAGAVSLGAAANRRLRQARLPGSSAD